MEVKQIAGNMNRTKLSTNNFVTEQKTTTGYLVFKAMYQSLSYYLCKQQEKANENKTNI